MDQEFETYCGKMKDELERLCGEKTRITLTETVKNNGLVRWGFQLMAEGRNSAVILYVDDFYKDYQNGIGVGELARMAFSDYKNREKDLPGILKKMGDVSGLEGVRDRIIYKLVNYEKNEKLLGDIPHVRFCDLAAVFSLAVDLRNAYQMSAMISNECLERWGIDSETLFGIAAANTQRRFPTSVKTMAEVMREIVSESMGEEQGEDFLGELFSVPQTCPMYVMSNSVGIYGAAVVLYDGELRRLASALGRDLIILPSSVHEVLVIPYNEELVMGDLREMVRHVNESEVPEEEVLSDNVYWYNRDTDTISIIYDRQKDVTEGSVPR